MGVSVPEFSEEEVTAAAEVLKTMGTAWWTRSAFARAVLVASGAVPGAEHERLREEDARRHEVAWQTMRGERDEARGGERIAKAWNEGMAARLAAAEAELERVKAERQ